jgi:hypothetical protein
MALWGCGQKLGPNYKLGEANVCIKQRVCWIKLYIKFALKVATVINELGSGVRNIFKYNNLSAKYFTLQEKLEKIQIILADKNSRKLQVDRFLETIKVQDDLVTEFSPEMFSSLIDIVEVFSKKEIKIHFKNGEEVVVDLLRKKK